jgi:hypothetical protein
MEPGGSPSREARIAAGVLEKFIRAMAKTQRVPNLERPLSYGRDHIRTIVSPAETAFASVERTANQRRATSGSRFQRHGQLTIEPGRNAKGSPGWASLSEPELL